MTYDVPRIFDCFPPSCKTDAPAGPLLAPPSLGACQCSCRSGPSKASELPEVPLTLPIKHLNHPGRRKSANIPASLRHSKFEQSCINCTTLLLDRWGRYRRRDLQRHHGSCRSRLEPRSSRSCPRGVAGHGSSDWTSPLAQYTGR